MAFNGRKGEAFSAGIALIVGLLIIGTTTVFIGNQIAQSVADNTKVSNFRINRSDAFTGFSNITTSGDIRLNLTFGPLYSSAAGEVNVCRTENHSQCGASFINFSILAQTEALINITGLAPSTAIQCVNGGCNFTAWYNYSTTRETNATKVAIAAMSSYANYADMVPILGLLIIIGTIGGLFVYFKFGRGD